MGPCRTARSRSLVEAAARRATPRVAVLLLVFDAVVMFLVAQSSGIRDAQIDTRAMQFLADHQGLSRTYTLGPIRPNYGAYFRVATIDHSALPVPRLWVDYVEHNLLPGFKRIDAGTTFWPGFMLDRDVQQALSQNVVIIAISASATWSPTLARAQCQRNSCLPQTRTPILLCQRGNPLCPYWECCPLFCNDASLSPSPRPNRQLSALWSRPY